MCYIYCDEISELNIIKVKNLGSVLKSPWKISASAEKGERDSWFFSSIFLLEVKLTGFQYKTNFFFILKNKSFNQKRKMCIMNWHCFQISFLSVLTVWSGISILCTVITNRVTHKKEKANWARWFLHYGPHTETSWKHPAGINIPLFMTARLFPALGR